MKFFEFPQLVQLEIFKNMRLSDLIVFGQTSKKQYTQIQILMKNRFNSKEIDTICYHSKGPDTCNISIINSYQRGDILIMKPSLKEENLEPRLKMKLFGMELECCISDLLTVFCTPENGPTVLQTIHDQIYNFFGNTVAHEVRITRGEYIPKLHHITSSFLKLTSTENVEGYFENLPNQRFLFFYNAAFIPLSRIPHCPNTENLRIWGFKDREETLKQFNGRNLRITSGSVSQEAVIQCLKRWKSGDGYQNLERLTINDNFRRNRIFRNIEAKQFEDEFEPPVHHSWIKRSNTGCSETIFFQPSDFTSRHYIVRETDGHVAYLEVTENDVILAVWNLTLEQLREYKPQPSKNINVGRVHGRLRWH